MQLVNFDRLWRAIFSLYKSSTLRTNAIPVLLFKFRGTRALGWATDDNSLV